MYIIMWEHLGGGMRKDSPTSGFKGSQLALHVGCTSAGLLPYEINFQKKLYCLNLMATAIENVDGNGEIFRFSI